MNKSYIIFKYIFKVDLDRAKISRPMNSTITNNLHRLTGNKTGRSPTNLDGQIEEL